MCKVLHTGCWVHEGSTYLPTIHVFKGTRYGKMYNVRNIQELTLYLYLLLPGVVSELVFYTVRDDVDARTCTPSTYASTYLAEAVTCLSTYRLIHTC